MFKRIRIALLLFILATVALGSWRAQMRATSWKNTLHVAVFPLNADNSEATEAYIRGLGEEHFEDIESAFARAAGEYGVTLSRPVDVMLGQRISRHPPALPSDRPSMLDSMLWSLQLRWWAWRNTPATHVRPDVRLYVMYHDPAISPEAPHSRGLQKGQIGVIHGFAARAQTRQNSFVIAHELLHTLGASDKYDMATNLPLWPDGYAEPQAAPRHPQKLAEIMGGRIPLNESEADMPASLQQAMIGPATAREIGWLKEK